MEVNALVVGLHLRWKGVWQRPNHILSRFAKGVPVIVAEEPMAGARDLDLVTHADGCTIVQPYRRYVSDMIDDRLIATVRDLLAGRSPLVWLYSPLMLPLADGFPEAPLVYDKMDDLARFKDADPRIAQREPLLLERATVVFAGGRSLAASVKNRNGPTHCLPSGVDVRHFQSATSPVAELARVSRPRIGYVGVIDERIDLELIETVASEHPQWTIFMVGPTAKIDPATLPRVDNIRYLGKRAYEQLPAILAGFDVGIMPFAKNEATVSISPTKTLEYLAAGVPVVSTSIPDVVADFTGIVSIADGATSFGHAIQGALASGRAISDGARRRLDEMSWDAIAAQMSDNISDAGVTMNGAAFAAQGRAASALTMRAVR